MITIRGVVLAALIAIVVTWGTLHLLIGEAQADDEEPGGYCASSIWQDEDGTVHGPFVSCGPHRLVIPGVSYD